MVGTTTESGRQNVSLHILQRFAQTDCAILLAQGASPSTYQLLAKTMSKIQQTIRIGFTKNMSTNKWLVKTIVIINVKATTGKAFLERPHYSLEPLALICVL